MLRNVSINKALAGGICAALVVTSPGPFAYQAAASVVRAPVGAAAKTTAVPLAAPSVGGVSGAAGLSSPLSSPAGLGSVLPVLEGLTPAGVEAVPQAQTAAAVPGKLSAPAVAVRGAAAPVSASKVPAAGKAAVSAGALKAPASVSTFLKDKKSFTLTQEQAASMPASGAYSFGTRLLDRILGRRSPSAAAPASVQGRAPALRSSGLRPAVRRGARRAKAKKEAAVDADIAPPSDLGLPAEELEKVTEFTSELHDKIVLANPQYGFTVRDYYAWARFIRFFTPSMGVREALKRGSSYIYADRLDTPAERKDFQALLEAELKNLKLKDPDHGKDEAKAAELLKIAEPHPETVKDDEESPFHFPLSELIPDKAKTALITTPTTLERIESAYNAFALRDYMLMVGPPATAKSAIPKYLAGEYGIPHMAVTLHPGIGTFELVGGYRPKEVRIKSVTTARKIIEAALRAGEAGEDYSEVLEAASKVYGAEGIEGTLEAIRKDLKFRAPRGAKGTTADAKNASQEVLRRLITLAHGIHFGSASLAWQDGYLTYAIKRDIWVTFEELNAAPSEVVEFLNEFLRSKRLVITEKIGEPEVIAPRKGGRFMLWATMNPETDSNRQVLADTLKNRWRMKNFGPLPPLEQAEILEEKYGLPQVWALALVENIHHELRRQAVERLIGHEWRDGYEINLRHLLRVAKRWKILVAREEEAQGSALDDKRRLFLLGREAFSIYGGMMRHENEREGVYTIIDQALKLSNAGVSKSDDLRVHPERIEDLGDSIRIGDIVLEKGKGGPFVPKPSKDYMVDQVVMDRLYEYAKAIAAGEPLLLMGDTAAGKTSDLEYLFYRMNRSMRYRNLHSDSAIEEVIGGYTTGEKRGQFVFQEGMLPASMEEGTGAFLDEFNLNPLVEWLNTVTDDDKLYLPHRIVEGKPQLVAAANPPSPRYEGRILLSPAVRSRWTEIWVTKDESKGRLKKLMDHWLKGGTVYGLLPLLALSLLAGNDAALPLLFLAGTLGAGDSKGFAGIVESLKRLWPFKKKASTDDDDDAPALPKSLDELLDEKKIPDDQRPELRAKVERVRKLIHMVGASVGRDTTLKWEPGYMWAIFPDENTATYPLEHLLTHEPEEVVGLTDHEALHREVTVLDERFPLVRKYTQDPIKHLLWNGMEDPRVNSRGIHRLPGAERYLHAAYDRYLPEDLEEPPVEAVNPNEDLSVPEGDGASVFNPKVLKYPHIEYIMAANYYWRYGKKPPKFVNRSAEEAFDKGFEEMKKVFDLYPRDNQPTDKEKLAYSLEALKLVDEKLLPLYEPLVKQSAKKMAKEMRRKGKGKNKGKQGGPGTMPPDKRQKKREKPRDDKGDKKGKSDPNGDGRNDGKKDEKKDDPKGGGGKRDEDKDKDKEKDGAGGDPDEKIDKGDLKRAEKMLRDHAREAAKKLGKRLKENPKRKDAGLGKKDKKGQTPGATAGAGDSDSKPLSIEDVARTQRMQRMSAPNTPFKRGYRRVAPLVGQMVSRFENIFQLNARPKDIGFFRRGKKPHMQRAMRREGEGGLKQDIWLRRIQNTKRSYKVTLLVDESGSMADKVREAVDAVILLMEGLARLKIEVEVIGFNKTARIHKKFSQPLTPELREQIVAEIEESMGGATHDADALQLALDRILAEQTDQRMIYVVTDGEGNGSSKLASVLPKAEKENVYVMGVGVGPGMAYVEEAYPRHALVDNIRDLPKTLFRKMEEYIHEIEKAAFKRSAGRAMNFALGAFGTGTLPAVSAKASSRLSKLWSWLRTTTWLRALAFAAVGALMAAVLYHSPVVALMAKEAGLLKVLGPAVGIMLLAAIFFNEMGAGLVALSALTSIIAPAVPTVLWPLMWLFLTLVGTDTVERWAEAKFGLLSGRTWRRLRDARPDFSAYQDKAERSEIRRLTRGLTRGVKIRIATLRELEARPDSDAFLPMVSLLTWIDLTEDVQVAAVRVLGRWAEFNPEAKKSLEDLLASKTTIGGTHRAAQAELDRLEQDESVKAEDIEPLVEPIPEDRGADEMTSLIGEARTAAERLDSRGLSGRLRGEALERWAGKLERALEGDDGDAVRIAAERVRKLLKGAKEVGAGTVPGANNILASGKPGAKSFPWKKAGVYAASTAFTAGVFALAAFLTTLFPGDTLVWGVVASMTLIPFLAVAAKKGYLFPYFVILGAGAVVSAAYLPVWFLPLPGLFLAGLNGYVADSWASRRYGYLSSEPVHPVPGRSMGEFGKVVGPSLATALLAPLVIGAVIYFELGGLGALAAGLGYLAVGLRVIAGNITVQRHKPMSRRNVKGLMRWFEEVRTRHAIAWEDAFAGLVDADHAVRKSALERLRMRGPWRDPLLVELLEMLARAESTPENFRLILKILAETGEEGPLRDLHRDAPDRFKGDITEAIELSEQARRENEGSAAEVLEKVVDSKGRGGEEELLEKAKAVLAGLRGDSLKVRTRRAALSRAIENLEEAKTSGDTGAIAVAEIRLKAQLDSVPRSMTALVPNRVTPKAGAFAVIQALPGQGMGSYKKRGRIWMALEVAGVAFFFIGALTGLNNGLAFIGGLAAFWTGFIMDSKTTSANADKPLANKHVKALRKWYKGLSKRQGKPIWGDYFPGLIGIGAHNRLKALEELQDAGPWRNGDLAELLGDLARAETTPENFTKIVEILGEMGAETVLKELAAEAPAGHKDVLAKALGEASEVKKKGSGSVAEMVEAAEKAPAGAHEKLLEEAREVLRGMEDKTLSARARRDALVRSIHSLESALTDRDADAARVAAERLKGYLRKARHFGFILAGEAMNPIAPGGGIVRHFPKRSLGRHKPGILGFGIPMVMVGGGVLLVKILGSVQMPLPLIVAGAGAFAIGAVMQAFKEQKDRLSAMSWRNIRAIRARFKTMKLGESEAWRKRFSELVRASFVKRFRALQALQDEGSWHEAEVIELLGLLAEAEASAHNFRKILEILGDAGAVGTLERLEALAPAEFKGELKAALTEARRIEEASEGSVSGLAEAVEEKVSADENQALLDRAREMLAGMTGRSLTARARRQSLERSIERLEKALSIRDAGRITVAAERLKSQLAGAKRGMIHNVVAGMNRISPAYEGLRDSPGRGWGRYDGKWRVWPHVWFVTVAGLFLLTMATERPEVFVAALVLNFYFVVMKLHHLSQVPKRPMDPANVRAIRARFSELAANGNPHWAGLFEMALRRSDSTRLEALNLLKAAGPWSDPALAELLAMLARTETSYVNYAKAVAILGEMGAEDVIQGLIKDAPEESMSSLELALITARETKKAGKSSVAELAERVRPVEDVKDENEKLLDEAKDMLSGIRGGSLATRMRREALSRAVGGFEKALAAGDGAAVAIAAKRLRDQMTGAAKPRSFQFAPGSVNNVTSPRKAPRKGILGRVSASELLVWTAWAAYMAALHTLPYIGVLGVGALAGGAAMLISWRLRDGSIFPLLLFMTGMSAMQVMLSTPAGWVPWIFTAFGTGSALLLSFILRKIRFALPLGVRWELQRIRKAKGLTALPKKDGYRKVSGQLLKSGGWRMGVLKAVKGKAWAAKLIPMVSVLARRDPSANIRYEAVEVLGSLVDDLSIARRGLEETAAAARPNDAAGARAQVLLSRIQRREEADAAKRERDALAELAGREAREIRRGAEALLERARELHAGLPDRSFSARTRKESLAKAIGKLESALESGDKGAIAVASKRLEWQIKTARSAGAFHFAPGAVNNAVPPGIGKLAGGVRSLTWGQVWEYLKSDKFAYHWMQASWIVPIGLAFFIGEAAWIVFGASFISAMVYYLLKSTVFRPKETFGYSLDRLEDPAHIWLKSLPEAERRDVLKLLKGVPRAYKKGSKLRIRADHPAFYLFYSIPDVRELAWSRIEPVIERLSSKKTTAKLLGLVLREYSLMSDQANPGGIHYMTTDAEFGRLGRMGPDAKGELLDLLDMDLGPFFHSRAIRPITDNGAGWRWSDADLERLRARSPMVADEIEKLTSVDSLARLKEVVKRDPSGRAEAALDAAARAVAAAEKRTSMVGRRWAEYLRRLSRQLEAALEGGSEEALVVAIKRLESALKRSPGFAFQPGASNRIAPDDGPGAGDIFLRRIGRFFKRPDVLTALIIPISEALIFGGVYTAFQMGVPVPAQLFFLATIGTGIVTFGKGFGKKTQRIGALGFLLSLSLTIAGSSAMQAEGILVLPIMGWFAMTFLLSHVLIMAMRRARMDFLPYGVRGQIRRSVPSGALSPLQKDWLRMLSSYHKLRRQAFSEMLERPEEAEAAGPAVAAMIRQETDPVVLERIVGLLGVWGSERAVEELRFLKSHQDASIRALAEATLEYVIERRKANAEMEKILKEVKKPSSDGREGEARALLEEAGKVLEIMGEADLMARERKKALGRAMRGLEGALASGRKDRVIIALERLRKQMPLRKPVS